MKDDGLGVLITDHNVQDTLRIVDRAAIIDKGRIVEEGSPEVVVASRSAAALSRRGFSSLNGAQRRITMVLKCCLDQRQVQKLILAPALQQAIKLLLSHQPRA